MRKTKPYSKPGPIGGKLIRQTIATLRAAAQNDTKTRLSFPLSAHILIAVSGGSDSMALARLMVRYGRRVGDPKRIRLVHINHGWRGAESDADEAFVRAAAKRWGVPLSVVRVKPVLSARDGRSPEEAAREQRKRIFAKMGRKYGNSKAPAWILTAHHADDLAETMIWRFFTGTVDSHGGGIAIRHGQELRPLLQARKRELIAFLREEGESWREDRTNYEGVLFRSKLRIQLMPVVESLFPRAIEHLTRLALHAQMETQTLERHKPQVDASVLFSASGLAVRRAHWDWLKGAGKAGGRLMLPGGWALSNVCDSRGERWVLERRQRAG